MAAHFSLIFLSLSALVCCSTGAIAGLSLEEQLRQLNDNYVSFDKITINEINTIKW
jgi:hypothetical protein